MVILEAGGMETREREGLSCQYDFLDVQIALKDKETKIQLSF